MKVRRIDFSPTEWLEGTQELSAVDRGVYITVCALIYARGGPITDDLVRDACRDHGNTVNASLARLEKARKILRNGPEITQKRCENELETSRKRSVNGSENASKRWNLNRLDDQSALRRDDANHQPSTTNHQLIDTPNPAERGFSDSGKNSRAAGTNPRALGTNPRAKAPDPGLPMESPWEQRCTSWAKSGFWAALWGPKPDERGCLAPPDLVKAAIQERKSSMNGAAA